MRIANLIMAALLLGAQGTPPAPRPPLGLPQPQTPQQSAEEKRAFCQRVAGAAARCALAGGLSVDVMALTSCLLRSLPPADSLRVAQAAGRAQGGAGAVLSECGIGQQPAP